MNPTSTDIDRSLTRLEASTQLRKLAKQIQLANGAMIAYACGLTDSDDHTINEKATRAIKLGAKISKSTHLLLDCAINLENADKDDARERDEDAFFSKIIRAHLGGEE